MTRAGSGPRAPRTAGGCAVFVKICGITRLEDAEAAVNAGATALGFVFWPGSPRAIDPHRARAIVASLPPFVTAVGVFVDQPAEYVNEVAGLAQLGAVQLHGGESADYVAAMSRPVVKAVAIRDGVELDADASTSGPPAWSSCWTCTTRFARAARDERWTGRSRRPSRGAGRSSWPAA